MPELATIEQHVVPAVPRAAREPRISKALRQAIDLLETGECKTQKAAAIRAGLNDQYLSRALKKVEIQAFIARKAAENIQRGVLRASTRMVELIDAQSEHVAAKVSERLLEHGGILRQQSGHGVNVSIVNNVSAGYVIDLSGQAGAPAIEHEASAVQQSHGPDE